MKKVNISVKQMGKFAGQWVAIKGDKIVAAADTLREIGSLVTRKAGEKKSLEKMPAAFKVPYKGEGPYIL